MRSRLVLAVCSLLVPLVRNVPLHAGPLTVTLVDDSTPGYYNDSIGTLLDGTNPLPHPIDPRYTIFMFLPRGGGDYVIDPVPYEPDLSTASSVLGNWLSDPANLDSRYWSGPMAVPKKWALYTETAVVYEVDVGPLGMKDVVARFAVDNGVFLWVDGRFVYGGIRPGIAVKWEHEAYVGTLSPGRHYFQVLREDHGVDTNYFVRITGTPLPSPGCHTLTLIGALLAAARARRRGLASHRLRTPENFHTRDCSTRQ